MWGMIGVARELAAMLKTEFRVPEPRRRNGGLPTSDYTLRVEAKDLCPRYDLRRVSGLAPGGGSPLWMRQRIHAAGMRPVGAVVDATNYVMLESGQPIHAFDAAKVRRGMVVRRALPNESLTLLDGRTRELDGEMLVIADEERGLIVAGVMGAEDAEVDDATTDALVEVATFVGPNILRTSQKLALRTDASGRYERGLDPNMVPYAMDRVTGLIAEVSGGAVAPDTLSRYPAPAEPWHVPLRLDRAELLLGMPVEEAEARERLELLGCRVEREDGRRLLTTVPTFRRDLEREADLVEEVGRLVGYENVPEELPGVPLPGGLTEGQSKLRVLRRLLANLGLAEAITYPFGPDRWVRDLGLSEVGGVDGTLKLRNPLSAEVANLRTTLLAGLLDAATRNRSHGARGVSLFEVGRVFREHPVPHGARKAALSYRLTGRRGGIEELSEAAMTGVEETPKVAGLLAGTTRPAGWNAPERRAGFFEAKGLVERVVPGATFEPRALPFLHPGRAAAVLVGGKEVGWVGELHPTTGDRFGLEGWPAAAFELDLASVEPDLRPRFRPFVSVPSVSMDLAVVVDRTVRVGEMLQTVESVNSPLLASASVFDVYEGEQVPEGKKSVALGFVFQGEETLTDEAVKVELDRISQRLREQFAAEVRGG
jgi:phenylalanyl-tRNA synthetase beta chain